MKATYTDFINFNPNCSGYANDPYMKDIFDLLNNDSNIIKMIGATKAGRPALEGCVQDVERLYDSQTKRTFNFHDSFPKQAVGNMVRVILQPFGYKKDKQKNIKKGKAKYFVSASCYVVDPTIVPSMKIEERIVEA